MGKLLKTFLKGILTTVMLPIILVVWCLYSVYCLSTFVVMFFINVVEFFRGIDYGGDLIEDLESRKIILEKEQADEKTKQMVNILYQNALNQAAMAQQMQQEQAPVTPVQPYGINYLSQPMPEPINQPLPNTNSQEVESVSQNSEQVLQETENKME